MTKLSATHISATTIGRTHDSMRLICRSDSMAALRAAVDNGADCIHLDYPCHSGGELGLNFKSSGIAKAIRYAHDRGREVILDLKGDIAPSNWLRMRRILNRATAAGIDGLLLSDPGLMLYCMAHHPALRLHYILPEAAATKESIRVLYRQFSVASVVLPRMLSLPLLAQLASDRQAALAVFGQGQFLVGSPVEAGNTRNALGSAHLWSNQRAVMQPLPVEICSNGEPAANEQRYTGGPPSNSDTLKLLPRLVAMGVRAVWAEAPDHAPNHLAQVTRAWREAIDNCLENCDEYAVKLSWTTALGTPRRALPPH